MVLCLCSSQKHQNKGNNKKCVCCKLTFLTKQETDDHRTKDHMPNYRGIQSEDMSSMAVLSLLSGTPSSSMY